MATALDGSPSPRGIYVYTDERKIYAVAVHATGFLRYRAGSDGKPLRLNLDRDPTPRGFSQVEACETSAEEAGFLPRMFETTADAIAAKLPDDAARLRRCATELRAKHPLL